MKKRVYVVDHCRNNVGAGKESFKRSPFLPALVKFVGKEKKKVNAFDNAYASSKTLCWVKKDWASERMVMVMMTGTI